VLSVKIAVSLYQEEYALEETVRALNAALAPIPFAMIVERQLIHVFEWDSLELKPLFTLPTVETLGAYSDDYSPDTAGFYQMQGLIMIWLRDVAFRWKYSEPPGAKSLREAGIAQRLVDGEIVPGA
jgi:hypothetical protein